MDGRYLLLKTTQNICITERIHTPIQVSTARGKLKGLKRYDMLHKLAVHVASCRAEIIQYLISWPSTSTTFSYCSKPALRQLSDEPENLFTLRFPCYCRSYVPIIRFK